MAGDREVFKEFLVSLGYHIEPASFKRFTNALTSTDKLAVKVGGSVAAIGVAAELMVTNFARSMENLFYVSRRTGASVKNLQAIGFGAEQIGLKAEDAMGAVEGLAAALRLSPGSRAVLDKLVGHPTTGQDTHKSLIELLTALKDMPHYIGSQYAGMFGMDERTFLMLKQGLPELIDAEARLNAMYKQSGIDQQQAAQAGREYLNTLREVWAQVGILSGSLAIQLLPKFQTFSTLVLQGLQDLAQVDFSNLDFSLKNLIAVYKQWQDDVTDPKRNIGNFLKDQALSLTRYGYANRAAGNAVLLGKAAYAALGFSSGDGKGSRLSTGTIGGLGAGAGTGGAKQTLQEMADMAADAHSIPRNLYRALVQTESAWNPNAVSSAGAVGLSQLMPGTAKDLGVTDRRDPRQNLSGGAAYLRQMIDKFGNVRDALAAYNIGPNAKSLSPSYGYADKILGIEQNLDQQAGGGSTMVLNQTNNIHVTGGKDGDKLARNIGSEIGRQTGDVIRNQAGATQ